MNCSSFLKKPDCSSNSEHCVWYPSKNPKCNNRKRIVKKKMNKRSSKSSSSIQMTSANQIVAKTTKKKSKSPPNPKKNVNASAQWWRNHLNHTHYLIWDYNEDSNGFNRKYTIDKPIKAIKQSFLKGGEKRIAFKNENKNFSEDLKTVIKRSSIHNGEATEIHKKPPYATKCYSGVIIGDKAYLENFSKRLEGYQRKIVQDWAHAMKNATCYSRTTQGEWVKQKNRQKAPKKSTRMLTDRETIKRCIMPYETIAKMSPEDRDDAIGVNALAKRDLMGIPLEDAKQKERIAATKWFKQRNLPIDFVI